MLPNYSFMKNIFFFIFLCVFTFCSSADKPSQKASTKILIQTEAFKLVMEVEGISTYKNPDKSIRVVKRRQKQALENLQMDGKTLRGIAQTRFKTLELLKMGFHDFDIINVANKPVALADNVQAYVWSGSYKDKKDKVHFFKEFITEGWTWNVYTDKKEDLKKALQSVQAIIKE